MDDDFSFLDTTIDPYANMSPEDIAFEEDWAAVTGGQYTIDEIASGDDVQDLYYGYLEDPSILSNIGDLLTKYGSAAISGLKSTFTKPDGSVDWKTIATIGGGVMGLAGLGGAKQQPTGYQGKIPEYTAVRERVDVPFGADRRPGSAGRRYFSDTTFAKPEGLEAARTAAQTQAQELATQNMASGGIAGLKQGRYLDGPTDGMTDEIPARIGKDQPAALSHGEFVIPADVVSHLGNGNSEAGAKKLYEMMSKIREARTGNPKQGKQINPNKYLPA